MSQRGRRTLPDSTVTITLDLNDPMDWVFNDMIETNRRKRADYAGADPFANFKAVAQMMQLPDYDYLEDCLTMICRKIGRIVNLRGRDAANETVIDSWLDLAVYATLGYA